MSSVIHFKDPRHPNSKEYRAAHDNARKEADLLKAAAPKTEPSKSDEKKDDKKEEKK